MDNIIQLNEAMNCLSLYKFIIYGQMDVHIRTNDGQNTFICLKNLQMKQVNNLIILKSAKITMAIQGIMDSFLARRIQETARNV